MTDTALPDQPDLGGSTPLTRAARSRRRRLRRRLLISALTVVAIVAGVAAVIATKAANVTTKVFTGGGSVAGLVAAGDPLRTDADGRVNILIFGTSQDDLDHSQGDGGQGMWLTDSIQLLSIEPTSGAATMLAVPRDTWVKQPTKCVVGTESKINAVYECAMGYLATPQAMVPDYSARDQVGAKALVGVVKTVTGVDAQYWVHINYTVVKESVDAVGGIDVDIVGNGHEGIFDTNLDAACPPDDVSCRRIYYPRDGTYHLSGQQALDLARARGDANPRGCMQFGLAGGDFDRQANQQRIMAALRTKAVAAGTLTNPTRLTALIDALGNNVTTDFSTGEARTAFDLARRLGTMTPISLVDPAKPVITDGFVGKQSVLRPVAGTFEYAAVHAFVRAHLPHAPASGTTTTSAAPARTAPTGTTGTTASGTTGAGTAPSAPPSATTSSAKPTSTAKSTYEPPSSCIRP